MNEVGDNTEKISIWKVTHVVFSPEEGSKSIRFSLEMRMCEGIFWLGL